MTRSFTDKERLDYLQAWLNKKEYTGTVILRPRRVGGFALHETERVGAVADVRQAIDDFMRLNSIQDPRHI